MNDYQNIAYFAIVCNKTCKFRANKRDTYL